MPEARQGVCPDPRPPGFLHVKRQEFQQADPAGQGLPQVFDQGKLLGTCQDKTPLGLPFLVNPQLDVGQQGRSVLDFVDHHHLSLAAQNQLWIVQGLLKTADANSPAVSSGQIIASLSVFVLLYTCLAVADVTLMRRYARVDPPGGDDSKLEAEPA